MHNQGVHKIGEKNSSKFPGSFRAINLLCVTATKSKCNNGKLEKHHTPSGVHGKKYFRAFLHPGHCRYFVCYNFSQTIPWVFQIQKIPQVPRIPGFPDMRPPEKGHQPHAVNFKSYYHWRQKLQTFIVGLFYISEFSKLSGAVPPKAEDSSA